MNVVNAGMAINEPEMDMRRGGVVAQGGMVRRLWQSLLDYSFGATTMGKPRRSVDRELQEYAPACE